MMEAGRELDKLVAEKVMGWTELREAFGDAFYLMGRPPVKELAGLEDQMDILLAEVTVVMVPDYSTDIAAAWELVEKLIRESTEPAYTFGVTYVSKDDGWYAGIGWYVSGLHYDEDFHKGWGNTAPLAICLAALKAKGVGLDND